jgi:aerotaxis receptor
MDEILGQPHNVIRHPDMPGGAFKIMWDLLLAGRPMAAYVKNLAQDGVAYWVFATITPLGDGFLSVRSRPCRSDVHQTVEELYQRVLPMEREARSEGLSRAAAAEIGASALAEGRQGLGLSSYEDFSRMVLPAEVAARRALTRWTDPDPRDPIAGPMCDMLEAAMTVDRSLAGQMASLEDLGILSDKLGEQADQAEVSVARLRTAVAAAVAASDEIAMLEPVLSHVVSPLPEIAQWLVSAMEDLHGRITEVHRRIGAVQVRIALTWLHDEQLGEFTRELAAEEAPERAPEYINRLAQALEETAKNAADEVAAAHEMLRVFTLDLVEVEQEMHGFQHQMATWRLLISRFQLSQRFDPLAAPIEAQLKSGLRQIVTVRRLADRCLALSKPFDPRPISAALRAVRDARELVNELAQPTPPRGIRLPGIA